MDHRFLILDVFAERSFGGNQLGVFPDARGLSAGAMQALARELNFAESTFVLPPTDGKSTCLVRIFTPRVELPFAGHPTLGTAAALAHEGLVQWTGAAAAVRLEEKAGPVDVSIERRGDSFVCEMTLRRPLDLPAHAPDRAAIAASLSLAPDEICDSWFAAAGVPFCFVELGDRAAVDRAVLDRQAWKQRLQAAWAPQLYFFSIESEGRLHARMFAPGLGVDEDPATGSAAAALAGSLLARRASAATVSLEIDQGVAMGRPSRIRASASREADGVTCVRVGGECRIVAWGTFRVPD
jgi:trans-2,3-dihydro-3-hydroxyanthranilate isomerase